jgi:hypothetical protein
MKFKILSDGSKIMMFLRGQYVWFLRWEEENEMIRPLQKGMADELVYAVQSSGLSPEELEGVPLVVSIPDALILYAR